MVGPSPGGVAPEAVAVGIDRLATLPCVVVGAPGWTPDPGVVDLVDTVVVTDEDLEAVEGSVVAHPTAAMAAMLHLRAGRGRGVLAGLVAESALFSALQAGDDHRRWRALTPVRTRASDGGERVRLERRGDVLTITLTRPAARNALDVAMRDGLLEALVVLEADPSLRGVLGGEGPSFCSGGDLDEFGTAPSPPDAHLIRLRRSLAAAIHRVAERLEVVTHGASAGSGVELAAFAGRAVARPDATFELPELSMGLIPGAGGTVSLPARIGRHRTAWLVLSGRRLGATDALRWGLVDEIVGP